MFIDDNQFKEKFQIDESVSKDEVYVDTPDVDDKLWYLISLFVCFTW